MQVNRPSASLRWLVLSIAVLALGLMGCGKVPTWSELTSSTPPAPPVTTPVPSVSHTETPPQATTTTPPTQQDPNQILQRFKSLGPGQVNDEAMAQLVALPTGLDSFKELSAWGPGLTNVGLARIAKLPALERLSLDGTSITDEGLKSLQPLTNLQSLSLNGTKTSAAGFQNLAALPNLKRLDLMGTNLTAADFVALGQLPAIEMLVLNRVVELNDAALDQICNASTLKVLQLNECTGITDRGLVVLAKVPGLEEVHLKKVNVTGVGFAAAHAKGGLKHLKSLSVSFAPINLAGARAINNLKTLEYLDIGWVHGLNDAFFAEFVEGLKHLKYLNLEGCKGVLGVGFIKLKATANSLETLIAQDSGISDQALSHLKGHKKLKFIDASNTSVTMTGIQFIKKALPTCEILHGGVRY